VVDELNGLINRDGMSKVAIEVFKNLPVLNGKGKGDECILQVCSREEAALLTNDRILLTRARDMNIKTLTLKEGRNIKWY
jgi:rRNA-processing protein FCF1